MPFAGYRPPTAGMPLLHKAEAEALLLLFLHHQYADDFSTSVKTYNQFFCGFQNNVLPLRRFCQGEIAQLVRAHDS